MHGMTTCLRVISLKDNGRLLSFHSMYLNNKLVGCFNIYNRFNPSTTSFHKEVCRISTPCFYSRLAMLCSEESSVCQYGFLSLFFLWRLIRTYCKMILFKRSWKRFNSDLTKQLSDWTQCTIQDFPKGRELVGSHRWLCVTVWLVPVPGTKPAFFFLEGRGPCAWRFVVGIFQLALDWSQLWLLHLYYLLNLFQKLCKS